MIQENLTHENILQVKEVLGKTTDGFFAEKRKLIVVLDYPFINLHREIANRTAKKIPFNLEEIRNIIGSTIKGYKAIEDAGYQNNKVRLRHIFFGIKNRESVIKVTEGSLIAEASNYQNMVNLGTSEPGNRDIYLSPEEFQAFLHGKEDFQGTPKSGVFSLGMSLLDLCVMDPSREAYHFAEKCIDFGEIKSRVEIAGKKYGGFIEKFLFSMLEIDPHKRSSFGELENQLALLRKNEDSVTNPITIENALECDPQSKLRVYQ